MEMETGSIRRIREIIKDVLDGAVVYAHRLSGGRVFVRMKNHEYWGFAVGLLESLDEF